jgi:activating signal cointegrator 1
MRTLSLWQPWCSLVAWGEKRIETRGWTTNYRGPLALHAVGSGNWTRRLKQAMSQAFNDPIFQAVLNAHGISYQDQLPSGSILCIVRLLWIRPTDHVMADPEMKAQLTDRELTFGNYESGRFAWGLELVRTFSQPIPAKGHQGFWHWDEHQVPELHGEVRSEVKP